MDAKSVGVETLHARVERWECDFNDHWNARFYARSFQLAAEVVASLAGAGTGAAICATRHIRYHRELLAGAALELRSAAISGGDHDGAIVHLLTSGGRIAATALDTPGIGSQALPTVAGDEVLVALPRSLKQATEPVFDPTAPGSCVIELGPARPAEFDHMADLLFDEVIRRSAIASHVLLDHLGLTQDFTRRTGIGRMAVEIRVRKMGRCPVGVPLRVRAHLASIAQKSLVAAFQLESHDGVSVAKIEHSILAVDLNTRRAVNLPDFMRVLPPPDPHIFG